MGKFKPFQHDEMVAAGKAKPYSRSDYKTKEMQENAKGGGDSGVIYIPIEIDATGDTPVVTSEISISDVTDYVKAEKNVVLVSNAENEVTYYPFAYAHDGESNYTSNFNFMMIGVDFVDVYCIQAVYNKADATQSSWQVHYHSLADAEE